LRAGRTYLVHARHQGSVVTASPNFVNTNLSDTAGLIIGQPHYLISLSMDAYYVGNIMGGGLTSLLLPAGNLSDTITMKTGGGSTGGGAWRTPINGAEIMVVRVA
jgi:hypothetical protein